MIERPLLIFPRASNAEREKRNSKFKPIKANVPSIERQTERLEPKFLRVEQAFEKQRATIQKNITGALPEQALVLETVNTIDDFIKAVQKIEGLEWLSEWETDIAPDEDFFFQDEKGNLSDKIIGGRLFLVMSDQQAMRELRSLWKMYQNQDTFPRGKTKWRDLFKQLKEIRPWSISDRFRDTGFLEDWEERVAAAQETIRFEIELWYRSNDEKRREVSQSIQALIKQAEGKVITESVIPDISYHAILAETPITLFNDLSDNTEVQFIRSDHVMFFRPVGQAMMVIPEAEVSDGIFEDKVGPTYDKPVIALFDGLPLENHELLRGRLIVDDPDNIADHYRTHERVHGTAMASLIIHGELDRRNDPISRPLYVRPVMAPDNRDWSDTRVECIPLNELPVDLIHRAVRRLFESIDGQAPVAPTVKVINFSIGDGARPFDYTVSPWAKLLDWLSYKYKVLFIVSAGNFTDGIDIDVPKEQIATLTPEELSERVVKSVYNNAHERRILTPSEAINCITVGALHDDSSSITYMGPRKDLLTIRPILSPASRVGLGYRRSIKPDIVMDGGRQLYSDDFRGINHFVVNASTLAPGHKVAHPGKQGELSSTIYMRGTSNATALATRTSSQIYDMIDYLKQSQTGGETISDDLIAVLIKSLLVHGASWGDMYQTFERMLGPESSRIKDRVIPRLIGYGSVDPTRVLECNAQRVTLFGSNYLKMDEAHIYTVPLPPSLSSKKIWRRLTITLGWLSPVNVNAQKYRQAHLWFDPPRTELNVDRYEADATSVKRGTIQHEILVGDQATPFIDGDVIEIKVNCRQDAGGLSSEVPYGLVVSLEVAEGVDVQVYDEVRSRIRPAVQIQSNPDTR
ncbi:MAG TPA: S8 family peptidase [Bacillus sp. (in: firmicutes)]|nr:S8 family peptidase [Bacillus sp. (in: firmicutes)]